MTRRWLELPDGPLSAAVVASQTGFSSDAIMLWRDILRGGSHDELAAACIAEAALRLGRHGLADHMFGQMAEVPNYLRDLSDGSSGRSREASEEFSHFGFDLDSEIAAFRAEHPFGKLLASDIGSEKIASDRPSIVARLRAPKAERVMAEIETLLRNKDMTALRNHVESLINRAASPAAWQWAILGLRRAGIGYDDPLIRQGFAQFSGVELRGEERALVDARLYRALGYPAFARLLLREALGRSGRAKERAKIRRRLAALARERDRWLDDRDVLSAADFNGSTPERSALLGLDRNPENSDPLECAFDWLFDAGLGKVEPYVPQNRLLMVGNTLGCGGMERMLARAYRHFSDEGTFDAVDLALLDFADDTPSAFYAREAGVNADDIIVLGRDGEAEKPFSLLPGSWKFRAQKLHDHIRKTKPRVIHAWNDLTGLLAAYAGLSAGCPKIIIHFHHAPGVPRSGRAEQIASYPAVYRRLRERLNVTTVFCAEAAARGYVEWWRVAQDERFRTLYNGFDWASPVRDKTQAKAAIGLVRDAPVIGTVMRFASVKQPLLWADAAIALAQEQPATQFLMVGDGPLREAVATRFADAGLASLLSLPGQVENVADYLAAMDLFWQTSKTEGLPNVLIEAQFSGVPVVAFDVGGVGETFLDGETGALVPADDIVNLAERSAVMLADQPWRDVAGQKSVEQAHDRFSSSAFFDGLAQFYAS